MIFAANRYIEIVRKITGGVAAIEDPEDIKFQFDFFGEGTFTYKHERGDLYYLLFLSVHDPAPLFFAQEFLFNLLNKENVHLMSFHVVDRDDNILESKTLYKSY